MTVSCIMLYNGIIFHNCNMVYNCNIFHYCIMVYRMVYTARDAARIVEGHDLEAGVHRHREVREVLGVLLLEKLQRHHSQGPIKRL